MPLLGRQFVHSEREREKKKESSLKSILDSSNVRNTGEDSTM